jgi:hypothetical protein
MNKAEIASYLNSLHSLIEAQSKGAHSLASTTLSNEYDKYWALLKDEIAKENKSNETRTIEFTDRGDASSNSEPQSQRGGGVDARREASPSPTSADVGKRGL